MNFIIQSRNFLFYILSIFIFLIFSTSGVSNQQDLINEKFFIQNHHLKTVIPDYPHLAELGGDFIFNNLSFSYQKHRKIERVKNELNYEGENLFKSPNPEWIRFYGSNLNPAIDEVRASGIDNLGNVYITGSTENTIFGFDIMTVKISPDGQVLWQVLYSELGNDFPYDLTIDNEGNVYIAGVKNLTSNSSDFLVLKYNTNGDLIWTKEYKGSASSKNIAKKIMIDKNGYILVAGEIFNPVTKEDIILIKYSTFGEVIWIQNFDDNGSERVCDLEIDNLNNIYIGGCRTNTSSFDDFILIKYDTNGNLLWMCQYNGQANYDDVIVDITLDAHQNILVLGYTYQVSGQKDIIFRKYDINGNLIWSNLYAGAGGKDDIPFKIAVDSYNNYFITGYITKADFTRSLFIIKYNEQGIFQWESFFNAIPSLDAIGKDLVVDNEGYIYVVGEAVITQGQGSDILTAKFNNVGALVWAKYYDGAVRSGDNGNFIHLVHNDFIYTIGTAQNASPFEEKDFTIIRFNKYGNQEWVINIDGPGNSEDYARVITIDNNDNVYVAGNSFAYKRGQDILIVKYDKFGNLKWYVSYDYASKYDVPFNMVTDKNGNLYVVGYVQNSDFYYHFITLKFDSSGNLIWSARYDPHPTSEDIATAVAVDDNGNVFVTGVSTGNKQDYDIYTFKYNSSGQLMWVVTHGGYYYMNDYSYDIAVDKFGYIYVVGGLNSQNGYWDFVTIKYDQDGNVIWMRKYNGDGDENDLAFTIKFDSQNNIYVGGSSVGLNTKSDLCIVKYSMNGDLIWVRRYNSIYNQSDNLRSLEIDINDNIIATGRSIKSGSESDVITIKYNSSGQLLWNKFYSGKNNSTDYATKVVADKSGNVYVTGYCETYSPDDKSSSLIIKYTPVGEEEWSLEYSTIGSIWNRAIGVVLDKSQDAFISGYSYNYWAIFVTMKFSGDVTMNLDQEANSPEKFTLSQNFPNPFNNSTVIRFTIPEHSFVSLEIFNSNGELLETHINSILNPGSYEFTWNNKNYPSGVIFYRIKANNYCIVRKMILLK